MAQRERAKTLKVVSQQGPDHDRCQALLLSDLLTSTSVRSLLAEGLCVTPGGRLSERLILAAHAGNPEHGQYQLPQCSRKAKERRDGYPVCKAHKRARFWMPWTPRAGMTPQDAVCSADRIISRRRYGPKPVPNGR